MDMFSKASSPVFIVQHSWHHYLLKLDKIMISTRKRLLGSDFCWFWHRLFIFFYFPNLSHHLSAFPLLWQCCPFSQAGAWRLSEKCSQGLLPSVGVSSAWNGADKNDGLQLLLGSFQRCWGDPVLSWDRVTGPHPLTLRRFPLWAPIAFSMSFSLESALLPLPFPWLLWLLLQLCFKSRCIFGFHTSKAVTSSVDLKNWLFWGWDSLRVTTAASDRGAHQSQLGPFLALAPRAKERNVAVPWGIYGSQPLSSFRSLKQKCQLLWMSSFIPPLPKLLAQRKN